MKREEFRLQHVSLKYPQIELGYKDRDLERTLSIEMPRVEATSQSPLDILMQKVKEGDFWCAATGGYIPFKTLEEYLDCTINDFHSLYPDYDAHKAVREYMAANRDFDIHTITIDDATESVVFGYKFRALLGAGVENRKSAKIPFTERAASPKMAKKCAKFPFWGRLFDYLVTVEDAAFDCVLNIRHKDSRRLQLDMFDAPKGITGERHLNIA